MNPGRLGEATQTWAWPHLWDSGHHLLNMLLRHHTHHLWNSSQPMRLVLALPSLQMGKLMAGLSGVAWPGVPCGRCLCPQGLSSSMKCKIKQWASYQEFWFLFCSFFAGRP